MLAMNRFLFFKNVCSSSFSDFKYFCKFSASKVQIAFSKTSSFHQAIKSFCSVYQEAGAFKVTYLWQLYKHLAIVTYQIHTKRIL